MEGSKSIHRMSAVTCQYTMSRSEEKTLWARSQSGVPGARILVQAGLYELGQTHTLQ